MNVVVAITIVGKSCTRCGADKSTGNESRRRRRRFTTGRMGTCRYSVLETCCCCRRRSDDCGLEGVSCICEHKKSIPWISCKVRILSTCDCFSQVCSQSVFQIIVVQGKQLGSTCCDFMNAKGAVISSFLCP